MAPVSNEIIQMLVLQASRCASSTRDCEFNLQPRQLAAKEAGKICSDQVAFVGKIRARGHSPTGKKGTASMSGKAVSGVAWVGSAGAQGSHSVAFSNPHQHLTPPHHNHMAGDGPKQ